MKAPNSINAVGKPKPATEQRDSKLTRNQQLGIMDNRLLSRHTEVKSKLIDMLTHYETGFTNGEVTVGKTDVLKLC